MPEILLRIAGASMLLLSLAHLYFTRLFDWRNDAARMQLPLNRQIFHVHTFFICLVLILMGLLCLIWPMELLNSTRLARLVNIGFAIFWGIRLFSQWFVYDRSLWIGKMKETAAHIVFTILWIFYTLLFVYTAAQ